MVQREERLALVGEREPRFGKQFLEEQGQRRLRCVERVVLLTAVILAWWIRGFLEQRSAPVGLYANERLVGIAANRSIAEQAVGIARERNLTGVRFKALSGREVIGDAGSAVLALAEASAVGLRELQTEKAGSELGSRTILTRPYKVEAGDTGYGIAQRLKIRYEELCQCNPGKDLSDIQIGEIIRIPQR